MLRQRTNRIAHVTGSTRRLRSSSNVASRSSFRRLHDQRTIRIIRRYLGGQHVLHDSYKGAVCFGRDDPLRFEVRLEWEFF
jgi:hypothetical protein